MKVLSLFSGMEGMGIGFRQAGFELVASNEVDPTICKTLDANKKYLGNPDILNVSIHKLGVEDLRKDYGAIQGVIGGFPCQVYSRAADIHKARTIGNFRPAMLEGVAEKIPTYSKYAWYGGDLFMHYFRIIATMTPQPEFFVIENVPDILGATIVRQTFKNTPCGDNDHPLHKYYQLYEGILQASDFGLPQDRDRYFFVGCKKKGLLNIRKHLQRRKLLVGDILEASPELEYDVDTVTLPSGQKVKVSLPGYGKRRLTGETCRDKPIITEAGASSIAPTAVAHYAKDRSTRLIKVGDLVRTYTPREYARLQGIPDQIEIEGSNSMKYLQVGNAVPVTIANAIASGLKEMLN